VNSPSSLGEFRILEGDDPVEAVLSSPRTDVRRGVGVSPSGGRTMRGSFVKAVIRKATNVDIRMIARLDR
jgi:hypothetical protein